MARYRGKFKRIHFRADATFATPEVYECVEAEGYKYANRLPANNVLQEHISYLLTRRVGCPPIKVRQHYANVSYQAHSWETPRRVVAKMEWQPSEHYPRAGFNFTNLSRPAERIVTFCNRRGRAQQRIKENKNAVKWTRLSRCSFSGDAVRFQWHAQWSLTSLREMLIKNDAKFARHSR